MINKRRDNSHIPFSILLCLAVAAKLKCKASLTDVWLKYSRLLGIPPKAELKLSVYVSGVIPKINSVTHQTQEIQRSKLYTGEPHDSEKKTEQRKI